MKSQTRSVESSVDAKINLEFGEKAACDLGENEEHCSVRIANERFETLAESCIPDATAVSKIYMRPSNEHVNKRVPSLLNSTIVTSSECAGSVRITAAVVVLNSLTDPSTDPLAIKLPFWLNVAAKAPVCSYCSLKQKFLSDSRALSATSNKQDESLDQDISVQAAMIVLWCTRWWNTTTELMLTQARYWPSGENLTIKGFSTASCCGSWLIFRGRLAVTGIFEV